MFRQASNLLLTALLTCVAADALAEDWKKVDAADLGVGSRKYDGKSVIVPNMRCYYADENDYRCTADDALVAVFTKSIEPPESKALVEDRCDTIKKAAGSSACRFAIKFVVENTLQDVISGYERRTVIHPEQIIIQFPPIKQRP